MVNQVLGLPAGELELVDEPVGRTIRNVKRHRGATIAVVSSLGLLSEPRDKLVDVAIQPSIAHQTCVHGVERVVARRQERRAQLARHARGATIHKVALGVIEQQRTGLGRGVGEGHDRIAARGERRRSDRLGRLVSREREFERLLRGIVRSVRTQSLRRVHVAMRKGHSVGRVVMREVVVAVVALGLQDEASPISHKEGDVDGILVVIAVDAQALHLDLCCPVVEGNRRRVAFHIDKAQVIKGDGALCRRRDERCREVSLAVVRHRIVDAVSLEGRVGRERDDGTGGQVGHRDDVCVGPRGASGVATAARYRRLHLDDAPRLVRRRLLARLARNDEGTPEELLSVHLDRHGLVLVRHLDLTAALPEGRIGTCRCHLDIQRVVRGTKHHVVARGNEDVALLRGALAHTAVPRRVVVHPLFAGVCPVLG